MHKNRIRPRKRDDILLDFEIQIEHWILASRRQLELMNKKKITFCLLYFVVPADHKEKIKESEKLNVDCGSELKKLWSMKVTVLPIVAGALATIYKGLERDWKDWNSEEESG